MIHVITGRGSHNNVPAPGSPEKLIAPGWDRSFMRGFILLGSEMLIQHSRCGQKMDKWNRGAFWLSADIINNFDDDFIENFFSVSTI